MRLITLLIASIFLFNCVAVFAGQKPTDDLITDQVRMKLAGDPDVKGGGLEVDVKDGVVTLKGNVLKERAKSKAETLAKKVKGVKSVINQLVVKPFGA